jgi:phosphoserine phosphatase RsbU/P
VNLELVIAVVYLACATLLFIISVLIFREDPRKRINRVTALMFGFAAFGPLLYGFGIFIGDAITSRGPIYNLVYVWELFFPQLVFFALVFPSEVRFYNRFPRLKYFIFIPHLFHLALTTILSDPDKLIRLVDPKKMGTMGKAIFDPLETVFTLIATGFSILLDSHIKLFSIVNFGYVIIAAVILYYATKRVMAAQLRKQVQIVIWGIIAALGMYVIAFILPALGVLTLSDEWQNFITILALIVGCGSIVFAIVRYRFMDVRLIVRQSLVYTVSSAMVVGAYVLIIRQFEDIVKYLFGFDVPGLDIVFIIIALILFPSVMSQVDELIRRFFIRDKSDYRNISQTFSRKVASVFKLNEVFALAHDVLSRQLLLERVYIFERSATPNGLTNVAAPTDDAQWGSIIIDPPLMAELARRSGVNNIDELLGAFPQSVFLQQLAERKVRFVAPMISSEEILGCLAVSDKVSGYRLNYEDVTTISIIADQLSLAINTSRLYLESIEKQRLQEEMNIARTIQIDLLPKVFPSGDDFHFSAFSDPSQEVGGDYFDFIKTRRGTIAMVIADASGKGVPAALLISQIHAAIRTEIRHDLPLDQILVNVNELLQKDEITDKFATLFLADFDPATKRLRYANAGHNYPILISGGDNTELDRGGLLLGAFRDVAYDEGEVQLKNGDILFLYTDGLNEAVDDDDSQYGEDRAVDLIRKFQDLTAPEIQQKIVDDVRGYASQTALQDDMTLVILKVH